jgi:HK97 family phage major capsid protein
MSKRLHDLEVQLKDCLLRAEAISQVAEAEGREFNADEQTEWNGLMDDKGGKVAELQAKVDGEKKIVAQQKKLAASLASVNQDVNPLAPNPVAESQPQVFHRLGSLKAFKGPEAAADAYASGQWLKALLGYIKGNRDEKAEQWISSRRGWDIRATATEGSPSAGGYLVPSPLSNAIIDVREATGVSRQVCRVLPMTADTLDVPHKTDGNTVYYPGEAGAVTASDQTWGNVSLSAKKRAILSYVSQELVDDAIIPVLDDLASQMGTEFAWQEDNELINGDGTATYGGETGLLATIHSSAVATAATGNDTWPELTVADHAAAMGKLDAKWLGFPLSWVCSAQYYTGVMERLMYAAGGNQVDQIKMGAGGTRMFMGYPVYVTSKMPTSTATATTCALFGAFSQAVIIGDRSGIRIATSDQFAFDTDRLAIRGTARYDINCYLSGASGPISAVKTAS